MTTEQHPQYAEALAKAQKEGMIGGLHRVEDAWGGYWQCRTEHGIYNFVVGRIPAWDAIGRYDDQ
jgi:hypothetical protein